MAQINAITDVDSTSIENLFLRQLSYFPQEKIHVHTDKASYVTGEMLWMRIHLVDGTMLRQANASRYVYVELLNPLDKVVERVMIRPDSLGHFYGHLPLAETLPEGNYTLRAYTRYMQNQGEDYFFRKSIHIIDPMSSEIIPQPVFVFDDKNLITEISFLSVSGNKKVAPQNCRIIINDDNVDGKGINLTFDSDTTAFYSFKQRDTDKGIILLTGIYDGRRFSRFYTLPASEKVFDVSFFPEGGTAPLSVETQVAFKALNSNGHPEYVTGKIYDDTGAECSSFEGSQTGLGRFRMFFDPERSYHAVCTNKHHVTKKFDLPAADPDAFALKIHQNRQYIRVAVAKSPESILPPETFLVAHIRGIVLYAEPWDNTRKYLNFDKSLFPAGIVHFLLVDKDRNILSERLTFSTLKSSFAVTDLLPEKANYKSREKINLKINITDEDKNPLAGNFSVSVIDKQDVAIDTISTIISTLLLSSELKGYKHLPYNFTKMDDLQTAAFLDLIMLIHGWRRYNIPEVLKGNFDKEREYPLETSRDISGKISGVFSSTKGGSVSLMAIRNTEAGSEITESDDKGRFVFRDVEYPDSTWYIVQGVTRKGSQKVFVELDSMPSFPEVKIPFLYLDNDPVKKEEYVKKSNNKYFLEHGMRVINLAEVEIIGSAGRKNRPQSPYYSQQVSNVITEEDIEKNKMNNILDLIRRLPGVHVNGEQVSYRGGIPLLILDNFPSEISDITHLNIADVSTAFFAPPQTVNYVVGANNGAIVINTKTGFVQKNKINNNINTIQPLGYQQTVEFYSPVYERDHEQDSPDLRTTIYWNPSVVVDESGTATLSFYSADNVSEYGVILEGISTMGHLIYSSDGVIGRK